MANQTNQSMSDYKKVITGKMISDLRTEVMVKRTLEGLEKRNMKGYFCQTTDR